MMLAGSNFRAEWKCPACYWEWQAPIFLRTRAQAGCPKCSRALKVNQPQPTFAQVQPVQLAEDSERNDAQGFYPEDNTLGSTKLVHWMCSRCPRGQPHRWTAPPYSRVGDGRRCPVCSGRQACVCTSLKSLFPSVAAELNADKNGFAPSEMTAWSGKEVWWSNSRRADCNTMSLN